MRTCHVSLLSALPLVAATAVGAHFAAPMSSLDEGPPLPQAMPPDAAPPDATRLLPGTAPPPVIPGPPPGPALECVYDNYFPLDDFSQPASQKDVVYPFFAEAADDFVLFGDPSNPCIVDEVHFAVSFFNVPAGVIPDPLFCWTGVKITIYEDIAAAPVDPTDPNCVITKGPAGYPDDTVLPSRDHVECFPGAVVCELKVPMSQVLVQPLSTPCTGQGLSFDIRVIGLAGQCVLEKNRKYWIAIAPEQEFALCGQTGIMLSQFNVDHPAMQYFGLLGIAPWTVITGNLDACPPTTPPAGSTFDLAISVFAIKDDQQPPNCPWDCGVQDKVVNIQDLLSLLAQWGGPGPCDFDGNGTVNIVDLLALLSAWGPCPAPPNDECVDKITFTVVENQPINVPVDMRGATPGDTSDPNFCPPLCVQPQKDVWYCLVYAGTGPADVTVSTTFDVFIEVYLGCNCIWPPILVDCRPGIPGAQFKMFPGDEFCVRLINYLNLPNEELKGRMDISAVPQIRLGACCDPITGACTDGTLETDCLAQGGIWFSNQTCADIVCQPVRFGACCIPGAVCIDNVLETDCLAQGGIWFGNRSCTDVDFCNPGPRDCPPGSDYGQRPHQPTEAWFFGTSDLRPGFKRYENFPLPQTTIITSLWFWGADLRFGPLGFEECNDPAPRFEVTIYPDDGTGHPVKTQPFCQLFGVPAREKNFKAFYQAGAVTAAAFQYKVNIDCAIPAGEWWVSIQGVGGQEPDCWFLWLSSPDGDGISVFEDQNTGDQLDEPFDLSLCINRPGGPPPSYDCEFCPFPPNEDGEECIQPELNCLYQILAVAGNCADPTCVPGNFLCASPCPPTQTEFCPGPIVNFVVGGGNCVITAQLIDPFCQVCPQGSCRLLITSPNW